MGCSEMEFRLATLADLNSIKSMYIEIVEKMLNDGLEIWDDIYPIDFIKDDIVNSRFYIMTEGLDIISGVAISKMHGGENSVNWQNPKSSAMYVDRLGVNIKHLNKGVASKTIENIIKIAKHRDVEYLRLFVVDKNTPAINLYEKNKFMKVDGIYNELIDDELTLKQYAYEIGI